MNIFKQKLIESEAKDKIEAFTEDQLQAFIYRTFWNKIPILRKQLFSVPNGGSRHPLEANKLQATGLVPGVPDLIFFSKECLIFFELKTAKGRLSDKQKAYKLLINKLGWDYFLIKTPDQFFYALILSLMKRNELNEQESTELMRAVQDEEGLIFFGLTAEQFQYEMKVFTFVFELPIDQVQEITPLLISEDNRDKFIKTVKKFIHLEFDYSNNFQLVFSEDFSSFVKQSINL